MRIQAQKRKTPLTCTIFIDAAKFILNLLNIETVIQQEKRKITEQRQQFINNLDQSLLY
jgi:hypothetical protein